MREEERRESAESSQTDSTEIFDVKARRCQRCGGILLSEFGLKHGMGQVCKRKHDYENAPIDENQLTLFADMPDDKEDNTE